MNNPFEILEARLSNIENILLDIKHQPLKVDADPDLMTVKEAAEFLNLTVPTIYSKVSRGELPFMKRSKRLYFSKNELLNYLKAGRVQTNKEIQEQAGTFLK